MQHRLIRALIASAVPVVLAACGGGGGGSSNTVPTTEAPVCSNCSPGTLTGTLASGAPIAAAEVTIVDANGARVKAIGGANGVYKLSVAALHAPFVIEILANVGGETVLLHSVATADDVGKNAVNVTPLTELITASVLGGSPADKLATGSADLSRLTAAAIAAAEAAIEARLQPVLTVAGIGAVDLRTTEFKADHTGIDKVLDAINVTPSGTGYLVALVGGTGSITVDPAAPGDASLIAAPAPGSLDVLVQDLGEIQAMLNEFAGRFSSAVPSESTLEPYFDAAFAHDGQNRADFINKVLLAVATDADGGFSYQGVRFDALRAVRAIDADTVDVAFRVMFRKGFRPDFEHLVVKRAGGKWVFVGNGLAARVRVSLLARLKENPLAKSTLLGLSGVHSFVGTWEGPAYTYYQRAITDGSGNPLELWLGREGDVAFGVFGWSGGMLSPAERLVRFSTTQYYATPDGRVSNYIVLDVPTNRVNASVTEVVVTGPGLPAAGLKLEPPIRRGRIHWVFKGDSFDWDAFNTDRCAQIDNPSNPVANCAMNWPAVSKGAEYVFTLKDGSGNTVAVLADKLRTQPVNETDAYAQRDALFPQFNVDDAHALSIQNVFNDAAGPFLPGKSVALNWTTPAQPGFRLIGVSLTMQTYTEVNSMGVSTDYPLFQPLFDADPTSVVPTSVTFSPVHPIVPSWVWTTLTGVDAFGNVWDHELSPDNPR